MGQHGFGTALIGSLITPGALNQIAKEISELPGIVRVFVITHRGPPPELGIKSNLGEGANARAL